MKKVVFIGLITFLLFSTSAVAQTIYTAKKGYAVAFSEKSYEKMMDAIIDDDKQYLEVLMANQEMMVLGKDLQVYLVKAYLRGRVLLRIKGTDVTIWTVSEAIK